MKRSSILVSWPINRKLCGTRTKFGQSGVQSFNPGQLVVFRFQLTIIGCNYRASILIINHDENKLLFDFANSSRQFVGERVLDGNFAQRLFHRSLRFQKIVINNKWVINKRIIRAGKFNWRIAYSIRTSKRCWENKWKGKCIWCWNGMLNRDVPFDVYFGTRIICMNVNL